MKKVTCEIEVTLDVIGGKWKPIILYVLIEEGKKRFGELKMIIGHTSQKTLTNQLRELERDGLINRQVFNIIPPKVEYSISEKGKSLYQILEAMCEWGEKNCEGYEFIRRMCTGEENE
ncbi:MAG: winged helix-turn-helix transcriptional regulator [Romboutsia sp.]|uniref:winged helix-turn-helix transcriptional regulator n=1 Tax=Romboutsia sp. TaxID=1965302 RepID=UPI003F2F16A4